MKAYVLNEAGAAENLLLREIEMPEISSRLEPSLERKQSHYRVDVELS